MPGNYYTMDVVQTSAADFSIVITFLGSGTGVCEQRPF